MLPCAKCKYRTEVIGDAHIQCQAPNVFDFVHAIMAGANPHGVKKGWFYWPFLFDPVWGPEGCLGFVAKAEPA